MKRWIVGCAVILVTTFALSGCACSGGGRNGDQIRLCGKTGNSSAAILISGFRTSTNCFDETGRTAETHVLTNVEAPHDCPSTLAVLAQDNAFKFQEQTAWTDADVDVVEVKMSRLERMFLDVWILGGDPDDAKIEVTQASVFYNGMQCGVDLNPARVRDKRTANGVSNLAKAGCSDLAKLKGIGFTDKHLNVYYVEEINEPAGARGVWCPGPPPMILIKAHSAVETLAHEIGHALTLADANPGDGLPADNLMNSGGDERSTITTGQCFRANLNKDSGICKMGTSKLPELNVPCLEKNANKTCPALAFDVNPK